MDFKKTKRVLIILAVIYWVAALGIFAIAYPQFRYTAVVTDAPAAEFTIGEVLDGQLLCQSVTANAHSVNALELRTATYDRENTGTITVVLKNADGQVLAQSTARLSDMANNGYTTFAFEQPVTLTPGQELLVELTSAGSQSGNAITIYAGTTIDGVRTASYTVNAETASGTLCVRLVGQNDRYAWLYYLIAVTVFFLLAMAYILVCWHGAKKGRHNLLAAVWYIFSHYSFLLRQLVARDFKTKYKRSYLGMLWSLMNPLLTMAVQYVVFSTLFRSDIPNYPVYLLTGIVFFNFFNEALTMGMTAITGNASLIKKVYMPKYIYPISRVMSSLVNFGLSLLPLALVMLLTGTPIRPALLLLIFDVGCYLAFIIGMTLLLTTAMTFFQDTQFLWGVVSLMWQYLTPVFYPESIIPTAVMPFYRLNPMYHYLSFARTCIIDGVSPEPMSYVFCLGSAVLVLLLGVLVFRKHQNKFVMYL